MMRWTRAAQLGHREQSTKHKAPPPSSANSIWSDGSEEKKETKMKSAVYFLCVFDSYNIIFVIENRFVMVIYTHISRVWAAEWNNLVSPGISAETRKFWPQFLRVLFGLVLENGALRNSVRYFLLVNMNWGFSTSPFKSIIIFRPVGLSLGPQFVFHLFCFTGQKFKYILNSHITNLRPLNW